MQNHLIKIKLRGILKLSIEIFARRYNMKFSEGEFKVMEVMWEGSCLNEKGEIEALELWKLLKEKYDMAKTSAYTFFSRLVDKGALIRIDPKYKLKLGISREDALEEKQDEAIEQLFQGSFLNVCRAFLKNKKVSKEELDEIKSLIDDLDKNN